MKPTTLQNGKYEIEGILGQGGFGITYWATQTSLDRTVAIKEFFMKDYCERSEDTAMVTMGTQGSRKMVMTYRDKFEKEARTLAKLEHPHIVRVIDVFRENNTSYYVMEYAAGASLKQLVDNEGAMTEKKAINYILQVTDALQYIHQRHICHLDIKPGNILTNANGEVLLADFGLAKQYDDDGDETSHTPVGKSKGYAPPEQYMTGGVKSFSPETDIYALGATLYFLLTGSTPPESIILNDIGLDLHTLSPQMTKVIQMSMQPKRTERITLQSFISLLKGQKPSAPHETVVNINAEPSNETNGEQRNLHTTKTLVAIKEFYINGVCGRNGDSITWINKGSIYYHCRTMFRHESSHLALLNHPYIIKILDYFETNNTFYIATEYIDGGDLHTYVHQRQGLSETESIRYAKQIGSALSYMHAHKMLHLDIKPSNILLRKNRNIVLTGFDNSLSMDELSDASIPQIGTTLKYSPIEQQHFRPVANEFPATMDVYALGATMYKMLIGENPPEATEILENGFPTHELRRKGVSEHTITCISKAMSPVRNKRYPSINAFMSALSQGENSASEEATWP